MPVTRAPARTAIRTAAGCLLGLMTSGGPVIAQPPSGQDPRDVRPSDLELRRRLEPLVPQIREAFEADNVEAQRAAMALLAEVPPQMAAGTKLTPALARYLQRKDVTDPQLLAFGLRTFGRTFPDPTDIPKVVGPQVRSESRVVRRAAAESLATVIASATPAGRSVANAGYFVDVSRQALPLIGTSLEDRDSRTQQLGMAGMQAAARVLTELYAFDTGPVGEEPKDKKKEDRFAPLHPVLRELAALVPRLTAPLSSPDADTRTAAARTLESVAVLRLTILGSREGASDPFAEAWPAIRDAVGTRMKDRDPQVRLAVIEALESIGATINARDLLRAGTKDSNQFVRWTAARAIGRSVPAKPDPAELAADIAALVPVTRDSDIDVRMAGLNALAQIGPAAGSATDAVLAAAGRGDVEPRVTAIRALGAMKTDAAATVPVLITSLKDRDVRVRRAAAAGLVRFGPDARPALTELRNALTDDDTELRLNAAEAVLAIERKPRLKDL